MDATNTEAVGFRLSPQQQQLLARAGKPQVAQCAAVLDGPIDARRLREAIEQVIGRHEILRTTFVQMSGMLMPQQVIGENTARALCFEQDRDALPAIDDRQALAELMSREAERDADMGCDAPIRALLVGAEQQRALLLLSVWAACADATSLTAILNEICHAYGGSDHDEEPIQYADYAQWRHELLSDEQDDAQPGPAFWQQDASTRPAPPRILFTRFTPHGGGDSQAMPLQLSDIRLQELQQAAIGVGASAPAVLEAVWHTLLARLSGAGELLVAGWCDGRAQADLAGAIGPYAQPVPIHSRFQPATTFAEIVDQVRRARANATHHQDYADAPQLSALGEQAAAGWCLHTMAPPAAPARAILALRPPLAGTRLLLSLHTSEGELSGELHYDPDAVERHDAQELAQRFGTLLRSALADPSGLVAELAISDDAERRELLAQSAGQAAANATFVHELLARRAQTTPDRPAVVDASQSLTYGQLDDDASRLANHLRTLGVQRGDVVGLCMERNTSMLVALFAILKAGAAYLPLNYEHPQARIAHQLSDTGACVIVTEQDLRDSLPQLDLAVVCVDGDREAIAACSSDSPEVQVTGEDLVYVMYTSGSTGMPKGVGVRHRNLANYTAAIAAPLSEGGEVDGLVFGVVSAISTDLGNTSIFAPLACAGTVRLISAEGSMDSELMAQELAGDRLDALKIAPSHLRALLGARAAEALPARWLLVGGEALPWELAERVRAIAPATRVVNHYGPTETTVGCTTHLVEDERRNDALTVPIGRPLAGVSAYVLDGRLQPLPAGVPGELCIGGAGVAAGYVKADERSGNFIADPFAADGGNMYRTGDRVRRLRDGAIEFLGRLDDQVKIRGFRVQPGEVEAALLAHDAVRQVAVCAEDDNHGSLRLAAYIVSAQPPAVEELRAFLSERLPDHMIPSAFRTAESLPLNASGKVDRSALSGLAELQARRDAEYVAPRDEVERQIAEIWAALLDVERVGVLDDFFALGGHSLLATQATLQIRRLYGEVPLRALLAAPTVAALADVVRLTSGAGAAAQ